MTKVLRVAHISMQFNDSPAQKRSDTNKIFARGYDIITGTEAGGTALNVALRDAAKAHGYYVHVTGTYDTWVAMRQTLAHGGYLTGQEHVMQRARHTRPKPPGIWGPKALVWASWTMPGYGRITVGSVHLLTKKGAGARLKKSSDRKFARTANRWGRRHGRGTNVVLVAGDFNLSDRRFDLFKMWRGRAPFLTCWDELREWPNTGHGNIDAVARYIPDKRVRCVGARVLNNKVLHLYTDHFVVEAEYEIKSL